MPTDIDFTYHTSLDLSNFVACIHNNNIINSNNNNNHMQQNKQQPPRKTRTQTQQLLQQPLVAADPSSSSSPTPLLHQGALLSTPFTTLLPPQTQNQTIHTTHRPLSPSFVHQSLQSTRTTTDTHQQGQLGLPQHPPPPPPPHSPAQQQPTQPPQTPQITHPNPTSNIPLNAAPPTFQFPNLVQQPPFLSPQQQQDQVQQFLQQQYHHQQLLQQYQQSFSSQVPHYQPLTTFPPPTTIQPLTFSTTQSLLYQTYAQYPPQPINQQALGPSATPNPPHHSLSTPLQSSQSSQHTPQQQQQSAFSPIPPVSPHLGTAAHSQLPTSSSSSQQHPPQQQFQPPSHPKIKKQPLSRSQSDIALGPSAKKPRYVPSPIPAHSSPPSPSPHPSPRLTPSPSLSPQSPPDTPSPQGAEFINYSASYFNKPHTPPPTTITTTTTTTTQSEGQIVTHSSTQQSLKPANNNPNAPLPRSRTGNKPRKEILIPSELLKAKQSEAARKLGMNHTRLSKRWRESNPDRKWPHRRHLKLGKKINMLLQLQGQGYEIDQAELRRLKEKREKNIQPTYIQVSEGARDPDDSNKPPGSTDEDDDEDEFSDSPSPIQEHKHHQTAHHHQQQAQLAQQQPQHFQQQPQHRQILQPSPLQPPVTHTITQQQLSQQLAQQQLAQQHLAHLQAHQQGFHAFAPFNPTTAPHMTAQTTTITSSLAHPPMTQQQPQQHQSQQQQQQQQQQSTQLSASQFQRLSPQGHSDKSP